ncbi:MAG TPA: MdtA/MuxA family multidrug efflux RND transporter periplasmic adaptor subunit [Spongiibacteraceae bacterium]
MALFPPRDNFKRHWPKKKWLSLALIAGALFIAWYWWGKNSAADSHGRAGFDKTIPVATAKAVQGELKLFLGGLGTVTPANSVLVKSRVDGQLLRLHFQEGQFVKAGELLAEIDPRPFEVQLMQAEGQLAHDTALLKNAQIDLERYQTLWSQDSIAKQQVDAQAALVRQYEGSTKIDEGQVANAKLQLTYAKVVAPASGRVGLRQVDPGNIVHASDTNGIVLITQVQPMYVVFTLPEDNLPRLVQKLNAKQTLSVDAYDRQQKFKLATGSLLTVDNQIDTTTGTVKLKAEFKNDDNALFPNQFVNIRMQIDTLRGVTLLPVSAVQRGAQDNFVYLLNSDNTVKLRSVRVGDTEGDRVVIEDGIKPGDEVITEGLDKLRDGIAVEPVKRDGQVVESNAQRPPDNNEKKHFWQRLGNANKSDHPHRKKADAGQ